MKVFRLIIILLFPLVLTAQQSKNAWVYDKAFKDEVFIKNNGQFDMQSANKEKPSYVISNGEMNISFSTSGLTYYINKHELKDDSPEGLHEIKEKAEEEFHNPGNVDSDKMKDFYINKSSEINIEWLGVSANAILVVENKRLDYYTYSHIVDDKYVGNIKAEAYEKLIYQNVYPNIDIEYYFPKDKKGGIKYNILIHPGGDITQVKMKYSGQKKLHIDENGDLQIETLTSAMVDHSPFSFYEGESEDIIPTKFILKNDVITFHIEEYDHTKKLVIDPWVTSPNFTSYNRGYGIRIDYYGNAYVYGGCTNMGGGLMNFEVKKFSPVGAILWTYTTPGVLYGYYGDIATTRTGESFIGAGFGFRPTNDFIIKLDTWGAQVTTMPGYNPPNRSAFEIWKLSYNQKTNSNTLYLGGGGSKGFQLGKVDLKLKGIQVFNSFLLNGCCKDIVYLAQEDDESFVYSTEVQKSKMVKVPTGTMTPPVWEQTDPTQFLEINQSEFIAPGFPNMGQTNGLNGMAVCDQYVYTYNGLVLTAWDKMTGASTITVNVPGGVVDSLSGIDVDDCCNVFVGVDGKISIYDADLVFLNNLPTTGDVFDLQLDPLNDLKLYATGDGFVELIDVVGANPCIPILTVTLIGDTICEGDSATIVATASNTSGYTFDWTGGGITGNTGVDTASNTQTDNPLVTTTYQVLVTDDNGDTTSATTVVYVHPLPNSSQTFNLCSGQSVTVGNNTYNTTGTFNDTIFNGSSTGCDSIITTNLTVNITDSASINYSSIHYCLTDPDPTPTIIGTAGGVYSIDNGGSINASTGMIGLTSSGVGIYIITYITNGICPDTISITINITNCSTPLAGYTVSDDTICAGECVLFTDQSSDANTWQWTFNGGVPSTSTNQHPGTVCFNAAGIYSIKQIASNGNNVDTASLTIVVHSAPTINAGVDVTIDLGQSTGLNATGTNGNYNWTPPRWLSCVTCVDPIATPEETITYTVTVVDSNGCTSSDEVTVIVDYDLVIFVPNIFSPNGDGNNDILYVMGVGVKSINFIVYDRWGEEVFKTKSLDKGWDGRFRGKKMNNAVFVYYLKATFINGQEIEQKGDITLIR